MEKLPDLNEVALFAAVAAAASFSGAARQLGVPVSTVSRKIAQLEERLGVALLVRTTRNVRTTEVGAAYYLECRRLLDGFAAADALAGETSAVPHGVLRVTAPADLGASTEFTDLITEFLALHPRVELELLLENRRVDLVAESVDCAIRAGALGDSSLIAQRLGKTAMRLAASAAFLARHPPIRAVSDLAHVPCLRLGARPEAAQWTLLGPHGEKETVKVGGPVSATSLGAIIRFAGAGLGVALVPDLRDDATLATLTRVLPEWSAGDAPVHLVYPARRLMPAKLAAFAAFVVSFYRRRSI